MNLEIEAYEGELRKLRQALAQPEQEPVGYVTIENISSWAQVPSIKWFKKPTDVATVKNEFNRGALWAEQVLKEKNT